MSSLYVDTLSLNESSVPKQISNCVQENPEKTVFKAKPSYSVTSRDIHADPLWCCVSVPRVPALWMGGDWLHFVSHAVLEGSQNRPPTPITCGILHKLKLCVRHSLSQPMRVFFFYWDGVLRGVQGPWAPVAHPEGMYICLSVNQILTSFALPLISIAD